MRHDLIIYVVSIIVIVVSFSATYYLPIPAEFRGLITLPGLTGLFSILIEAWRQQRAHERTLELQEKQQEFTLGVASHMANVTFDKQVEFCEKYFETTYIGLQELFRDGPNPKALEYAHSLMQIRMKFSPWLSEKIEAGLLPFEKALREIGSLATVVGHLPVGADRSKVVEKMFNTFQVIVGINDEDKELSSEEAISSIIDHLRRVIGISQLTLLRDQAIQSAYSKVVKQSK